MLVCEEPAGASQSRLNLIDHEQHAIAPADVGRFAQKSFRRNRDAGLALNRLDQKRAGVGRDRVAQRRRIAERNDLEARRERPEAVAILLVGGEADDGDGAAVKIVGADDDLGLAIRNAFDLVAPLARGLHRGLDRLGARVHGQRHLVAGQLMQLLVEQRQLIVAKGARSQRDLVRLVEHGFHDFGMAVSLVDRRIRRQAIQIAPAFHVVHPHALRPLDDHIQRMVIVGAIVFFELDEILGLQDDPVRA